jgi:hypothetical protein
MNGNSQVIFDPQTACLTEQAMFAYIDGKLSPAECHAVEKHLLDCAFCSEAMEGLELVRDRSKVSAPLPGTGHGAIEPKRGRIIPFNSPYKLAAAAAILLLVGSVVFLRYSGTSQTEQLSMKEDKKAPLTRNDSLSGNTATTSEDETFYKHFEPFPPKEAKPEVETVTQGPVGDNDAPAPADHSTVQEVTTTAAPPPPERMYDEQAPSLTPQANTARETPASAANKTITLEKAKKQESGEYKKKSKPADDRADSTFRFAEEGMTNSNADISDYKKAPDKADKAGKDAEKDQRERGNAIAGDRPANTPVLADSIRVPYSRPATSETTVSNALTQETVVTKNESAAKYETNNFSKPSSPATAVSSGMSARGAAAHAPVTSYAAPAKPSNPLREEAMKAYANKDFAAAAEKFNKLLMTQPADAEALFYAGVSYLSLAVPDTRHAISNFDQVLLASDTSFAEAARWYKALALIKENNTAGAEPLLNELSNRPGSYQLKANKVLNDLNKEKNATKEEKK